MLLAPLHRVMREFKKARPAALRILNGLAAGTPNLRWLKWMEPVVSLEHVLFSKKWGECHRAPTDFHSIIFQRGFAQNHQMEMGYPFP